MNIISTSITTDSAGDGVGYGNKTVVGKVYAVQLVDGDFADGVDVAIVSQAEDLDVPILTLANFNTDQIVYPREATASVGAGAALVDYCMPLSVGRIKVTIAQGGAAKTGKVKLFIE